MARYARISQRGQGVDGTIAPLTRAFAVERVTRIELAWPAWKTKPESLWLGGLFICKGKG